MPQKLRQIWPPPGIWTQSDKISIYCTLLFSIFVMRILTAFLKPVKLGVSVEYLTKGWRFIEFMTSIESASCGTHFGDTKLVTSMRVRPVADSLSMNSTFLAVST
jgi:hypothetical protein